MVAAHTPGHHRPDRQCTALHATHPRHRTGLAVVYAHRPACGYLTPFSCQGAVKQGELPGTELVCLMSCGGRHTVRVLVIESVA